MNGQIVALSVDKVQTFLTEVIHSHVQERQTEDATLKRIIHASDEISKDFFRAVQRYFSESEHEVLLKCSGVYIFQCQLSDAVIEDRLNKMFVEYYIQSQGQKLLRYTYFPVGNMDEIRAIQKAKKCLKQADCWNHIIEKNRELLFSFIPVPPIKEVSREPYPFFAEVLNDLRLPQKDDQEKNRFRIAVIKADLNGMGGMFKRINNYEAYKKISEILNDEISIEGLHRAVQESSKDRGWLFPFYIAGDDIFFAVAIKDIFRGINLCRKIIKTINDRISSSGLKESLSISVGVVLSWNREPIRYYMERVETQLKIAKMKQTPKKIKAFFVMKVAMGDLVFFDIDEAMMKAAKKTSKDRRSEINRALKNSLIWNYFVHDLRLLNGIRGSEDCHDSDVGAPGSLYTLLAHISNSKVYNNDIKYMNDVLYHLLPRHLNDSNKEVRQAELSINSTLLEQFCIKKKKGPEFVMDKDTKRQFQSYLRLMILFSDARFQSKVSEAIEEKEIERHLFRLPRDFIFKFLMKRHGELTSIFVRPVSGVNYTSGYQTLNIDKSMFFRLRRNEMLPARKAAAMIEIHNPATEERKKEIEELNQKRLEKGKLPGYLYFEKDRFLELAKPENGWSPDFVDALMIFYQYHELFMELKKQKKIREERE